MPDKSRPMKVFVSIDIPDIGIEKLRAAGFEVSVWNEDRPITQAELIDASKRNEALLCTSADRIDKHFLYECRHLRIISQYAAGFDNIDLGEATRLGIPVGYTPDAMSAATADVAFGLMIAVSRKMFHMHKTILKGRWGFFRPKADLGMELKNKTLGVFGLGRIGYEMAKRCRGAFDMNIIYCNRTPNEIAEKMLGAKKVTFDELLTFSDVLSVHCKLTDETRGIFNSSTFEKMKRSSIFINTSRGAVHNEDDLFKALENNKIWGAGLDVTNPEPMKPDHPLLNMENVCILPHIGSATMEARNEMSRVAAENIIEFYKSKNVPNILNAEVLTRL
jgi:glyoxylate reductase